MDAATQTFLLSLNGLPPILSTHIRFVVALWRPDAGSSL